MSKRMNHVKRVIYGSLSQQYSNKEIADKLGMNECEYNHKVF